MLHRTMMDNVNENCNKKILHILRYSYYIFDIVSFVFFQQDVIELQIAECYDFLEPSSIQMLIAILNRFIIQRDLLLI